MKKNKTNDFFGSKGFYIALFSAVLLVVAIAAVVSINNMNTVNQAENELSKANQQYAIDTTIGSNNVVAAVPKNTEPLTSSGSSSTDKDSQLSGAKIPTTGIGGNATARANTGVPSNTATGYSSSSGSSAANGSYPVASSKPIIEVTDEAVVETSASTSKPLTETVTAPADTVEPEAAAVVEQPKPQESAAQAENETPALVEETTAAVEETPESSETFLNFSESSKMIWPVVGEVAMGYSVDHVIYDKTLDHYRTNNGLSISAPAGSQVKSAAAGEVVSVTYEDRTGNTVVIDHGNGWKTTYGQLQSNVLVDVGQTVKEGQVIGGVDTPTRYGILLGDHLEFKVTKNDIPQDPASVISSAE